MHEIRERWDCRAWSPDWLNAAFLRNPYYVVTLPDECPIEVFSTKRGAKRYIRRRNKMKAGNRPTYQEKVM